MYDGQRYVQCSDERPEKKEGDRVARRGAAGVGPGGEGGGGGPEGKGRERDAGTSRGSTKCPNNPDSEMMCSGWHTRDHSGTWHRYGPGIALFEF